MDVGDVLEDLMPRSRNYLWLELNKQGVSIEDDARKIFGSMTRGDILRMPKMGVKCLADIERVLKRKGLRLIPVTKPSKIQDHTRGSK